jgi:hypothetical protein
MLLCLSSGFTPRYREDVLRAISMPSGARLRFRYELTLIPESLKPLIAEDRLKGMEVCVAYLDRTDSDHPPELVPCRAATMLRTYTPADFCVLEFELEEFWFARDVHAFNREIHSSAGNLPAWNKGQLTGHFCHQVNIIPLSLVRSSSVFDWQGIVKLLKKHADFSSEPFFYHVTGVFPANGNKRIRPTDGRSRLRASNTYEIRLVQFSPGETNDARAVREVHWLLAEGDDQALSFITNRRLAIDSGYDEKIIRFRTLDTSTKHDAVVGLSRDIQTGGVAQPQESIFDFDMLLQIVPRWWTTLWRGLVIGALIAMQGLVALRAKGQTTGGTAGDYSADLLVVILGLLTGVAASFGLRKP